MTQSPPQSSDHRNQFASGEGIYLLSHSIGKMPVSTPQYVNDHFFAAWQQHTSQAWPAWLSAIDAFKTALADLLNSTASAFCPQANVSAGLAKVLASLPKKTAKNIILSTENDFPSTGFVIQQARKLGFELRMLDKSVDTQDLNAWEQALTPDVHSVFITHVHYNTNKLIAVEQICSMARARDITSIVDTAQSVGVVPIDLRSWGADVVLGSCIKWLCGGPGAGFLWIAPELIAALKPLDVGWFSHRDPFEFDIRNFKYAADSKKFWGGTPSILPYVVATNSIRLLQQIGIDQVRVHNKTLCKKIIAGVPPESVVSPLEFERRGGTVVLNFKQQALAESVLREANVQFDARQSGMRLSPHIYNTAAEIEIVADCLSRVAE